MWAIASPALGVHFGPVVDWEDKSSRAGLWRLRGGFRPRPGRHTQFISVQVDLCYRWLDGEPHGVGAQL